MILTSAFCLGSTLGRNWAQFFVCFIFSEFIRAFQVQVLSLIFPLCLVLRKFATEIILYAFQEILI